MKIFSQVRPDVKNSGIDQEDKTNRTQPKNTPTVDIDVPTFTGYEEESKKVVTKAKLIAPKPLGGFNLRPFARVVKSADEPANKNYVLLDFNSDDWVFTQSTIVASVNLEENGFSITPDSAEHINCNGNGWDSALLAKWYKTFIGAHNYKDHVQEKYQSKGIILDAVLRKIDIDDAIGYVYYVDILVATNKNKDRVWADAVAKGKIKWMSMGAVSSSLTCSRCGNVSFGEEDDCEHQIFEVGMNYIDDKGIKRKIASLITDEINPEGNGFMVFQEASYLSVDPAYKGAVQGHIINVEPNTSVKFQVPRKALVREAFQYWGIEERQIKGVTPMEVINDEDVKPSLYEV